MIDWGSGQWYHSGPYGAFTTKSVGFNGPGLTSAAFTFLSPRRLVRLQAYNGGTVASTITLRCAGQPDVQMTLAANQLATVDTGWGGACTSVTISSTNGWDTNFDDLALAAPLPTPTPSGQAQTVTFDDLTNPNRPLSGQYPVGIVDWGTSRWYLSGPWRAFATNSVGFNGPGPTSESFTFLAARRLVQLDAYNGGTGASTISLTCSGQPTVTRVLAASQHATIPTNWTGTCATVTVGSTNGWDTNFDNLVLQDGP